MTKPKGFLPLTITLSPHLAYKLKRQRYMRELLGLNTSDNAIVGDLLAEYLRQKEGAA
jgi:hypothetical protein